MRKNNKKKFTKDLTEGNQTRRLIFLSIPISFSILLDLSMNLVDLFFVGKLGSHAIAALSISGLIVMAVIPLNSGLSIATTALVARCYGAKRIKYAARISLNSVILSAMVSVFLACFGVCFADTLLGLMGADSSVIAVGEEYLRVIFVSLISSFVFSTLRSISQATGNAHTPTIIIFVTLIVNAILDPMLIYGLGVFPKLGVAGAGYATLFSKVIATSVLLAIILTKTHLLSFNQIVREFDKSILLKIVKIALPSCLSLSLRSLSYIIIMRIVATFGPLAIAAYGAALRIEMLILLPTLGLGVATSAMVGQNMGVDRPEVAEKNAWNASFINAMILGILGIIIFFYSGYVVKQFLYNPESIMVCVGYFNYVSLTYVFIGISMILGNAFNGAGDTTSPLLITFATLFCLQLPLAYMLSKGSLMGLEGIWFATVIKTVVHCLVIITLFNKGKWKLGSNLVLNRSTIRNNK